MKYLQIFKTTWQNALVYRVNFIMWRARSFLLLLTTYFLWSGVFVSSVQKTIFNYQSSQIISYLLLVSLLNSVVMSSRTADLAWIINSGDLSNFLTKPLSIVKYFFSQDMADKILNILFLAAELFIFISLFRPVFFWQLDLVLLFSFCFAVALAVLLYFLINFMLGILGFWTNQVWAARFLLMTMIDLLAGNLFPLDILPAPVFLLFKILPFNLLVYFPAEVYLGRLSLEQILGGFGAQAIWMAVFVFLLRYFWKKGLLRYNAEGR